MRIPTHARCCFKFLATLNDEVNIMINEIWRGQKKGKRKMHKMIWERLHESKQQRGMVFRGISALILLISQV